jgi:hypothetical protein
LTESLGPPAIDDTPVGHYVPLLEFNHVRVAHREVRREHNRPSPRSRIDAWSPAPSDPPELAIFRRRSSDRRRCSGTESVAPADESQPACPATVSRAFAACSGCDKPSAVSSTASRINCCDAGSELLTRSTCWPTPSTYRTRQVFRHRLAPKVRENRFQCSATPVTTASRVLLAGPLSLLWHSEQQRRLRKAPKPFGSECALRPSRPPQPESIPS